MSLAFVGAHPTALDAVLVRLQPTLPVRATVASPPVSVA